jgi:hypothetical protein
LKCTWNFTVIPEMLLEDLKVDDSTPCDPGGFEEAHFYRGPQRTFWRRSVSSTGRKGHCHRLRCGSCRCKSGC